jgi:hypothetical protein
VLWGFINALYFLPLLFMGKNRKNIDIVAAGKVLPTIRETLSLVITFLLTVLAWIFFRSDNILNAFKYIAGIFTGTFFSLSPLPIRKGMILRMAIIMSFFVVEWIGRKNTYAIEHINLNKGLRWICYYGILGCIILFSGAPQTFIYFQF